MASDNGAGKGDKRRPRSVSEKEYTDNFERIFGRKINWWENRDHQQWIKEAQAEKARAEQL